MNGTRCAEKTGAHAVLQITRDDPTPPTPREQLMNSKAMFQRVLSAWAVDVLTLRRRGLDKPSVRLVPSARRARKVGTRRKAA